MSRLVDKMQILWWWSWNLFQSASGAIIVLALIPIITPILLLLWLWRCFALLLVRLTRGHWVHPADGIEALFALDSAGARAVICGATILRGKMSVPTIRAHLSEKIMEVRDTKGNFLHPKFRQVVEKKFGVVVWSWEETFNISRHVRPLTTDRKARFLLDEDDLVREVASRTNDSFVKGQAKWEVLVAPLKRYGKYFDSGCDDWDHTAVILRVHHALGDGRSLVGLIVSALVDPPLPDPRPSPVYRHPCNEKTNRTLKVLWSLTHLPWVMIRLLIRGDSSVLHGSRLGGVKHLAWSPPMSLDSLKRGRTLAGVSVNDLLLAGLSGSLYRHFQLESPDIPPQVLAVIPVDVTSPGTPMSLANRISLCTLPLPTEKMSPRDRLMTVHCRMNVLKSSPDVMVNYIALDLLSNLLPAPIARRLLNTHGVTMVVSNMPGPTKQINLFGEAVEDIMFWIPNKSRTGLGISILSYCGSVRLGINVDSELISHREIAQQLLDDVVSEVDSILADISTPEERLEAGFRCTSSSEDTKSSTSELTIKTASFSTDEYDSQHCVSPYSVLHSSSQITKFADDLNTTIDSEDLPEPGDFRTLRANFDATRLEIQSLLASGAENCNFSSRLKMKFNKSDTDVNIV